MITEPLIVICNAEEKLQAAEDLVDEHRWPLYRHRDAREFPENVIALVFDARGVYLQMCGPAKMGSVRADFVTGKLGYRRRQSSQPTPLIAKAVGWRPGFNLIVADVTAGLGQDAFVLAHLGCKLVLVERDPVIATLLEDALARALEFGKRQDQSLTETIERMQLVKADGVAYLKSLADARRPDIVYIDPMFPSREKSAKVKKNMQLLQKLAALELNTFEQDNAGLLDLALRWAKYRVVVKRPLSADYLGSRKAPLQFKGKTIRFDVYPLKKLPGNCERVPSLPVKKIDKAR